ncbi:MAG: adenylyltransferase/cytidyltransferase family protein [Planctomycetes bacterium]|nr:adenylyltransferase/cytidyltransferase family protein [Planctomycetota bacterium]
MNNADKRVIVSGGFDDIRSLDIHFLQEAARFGLLYVFLWNDESLRAATSRDPKFPESERLYFLQAIRYTHEIRLVKQPIDSNEFPSVKDVNPHEWIVRQDDDTKAIRTFCRKTGLKYRILSNSNLERFPNVSETEQIGTSGKKVLVTGCYDWFHSGHVRFFEEVSELGDLYVVVGHDTNIRLLKGEGHPMFSQEVRRYMVASIRYVTQALISTGQGWLDAEPELKRLKPDIYAVNEDGDKPEKRNYCREHGIEYVVLKRLPKAGLPRRESTVMRGF